MSIDKLCPICNKHSIEKFTKIDSDHKEITKYQCVICGYVVEPSQKVTYSNVTDSSYTTATSVDKYCANCNTRMESFGDSGWWSCPECGYGYMDYIGDLPRTIQLTEEEMERSKQLWETSFFVKDNESKFAIGHIEDLKNTIQFERCERIVFRDKTLDFVFEIPEERYKDIDTIIVNGHKFIRET